MSGYPPAQQDSVEDVGSEEEDSQDDDYDSNDDQEPWVQWFCSFRGHEFFCEIDEDYMRDNFNLTGLSAVVCFALLQINYQRVTWLLVAGSPL